MRDLYDGSAAISDSRLYPPLTTGKLRQTGFPDWTQSDFDLETLCQILAFWWLQFGEVSRQQLGKDVPEVAGDGQLM